MAMGASSVSRSEAELLKCYAVCEIVGTDVARFGSLSWDAARDAVVLDAGNGHVLFGGNAICRFLGGGAAAMEAEEWLEWDDELSAAAGSSAAVAEALASVEQACKARKNKSLAHKVRERESGREWQRVRVKVRVCLCRFGCL